MNPVFVRRGFNAAAGFIVPGSMLDNTFVLDSFVAAANNTGGRRRPRNNNNNMGLFSSPVAIDSSVAAPNNTGGHRPQNNNNNNMRPVATTRDVGPPNLHNGRDRIRMVDDTILLFDNNSYSIANNNTMGDHNNALLDDVPFYHSPQLDFINLDEIATTDFSKTDDPCSICLSELSTDSTAVQIRRCSHIFHSDCIQKWIGVSRTCPLCRINLL
ncbi:unnamed protein product [Trifolium pratense]|uniref:Uncharacterized protein n=1 Tax=Trifolium pratense TaxID=57577 RepID=A0ACB0KMF5_TRIPR|nr:unnamed protein product [Trifolium pratense]